MSSFDFTALIKFLAALFDAFKKLAEKLGFNFDIGGEEETTTADATE